MFRTVRFENAMIVLFWAEPGQAHWTTIDAEWALRWHRYGLLTFTIRTGDHRLINDAVPHWVLLSGYCKRPSCETCAHCEQASLKKITSIGFHRIHSAVEFTFELIEAMEMLELILHR